MLVSGHTLSNIVNPGSASCRLAHCDHRWQMKVCPAGAYCGCTGSGERRKQAEKTVTGAGHKQLLTRCCTGLISLP